MHQVRCAQPFSLHLHASASPVNDVLCITNLPHYRRYVLLLALEFSQPQKSPFVVKSACSLLYNYAQCATRQAQDFVFMKFNGRRLKSLTECCSKGNCWTSSATLRKFYIYTRLTTSCSKHLDSTFIYAYVSMQFYRNHSWVSFQAGVC